MPLGGYPSPGKKRGQDFQKPQAGSAEPDSLGQAAGGGVEAMDTDIAGVDTGQLVIQVHIV